MSNSTILNIYVKNTTMLWPSLILSSISADLGYLDETSPLVLLQQFKIYVTRHYSTFFTPTVQTAQSAWKMRRRLSTSNQTLTPILSPPPPPTPSIHLSFRAQVTQSEAFFGRFCLYSLGFTNPDCQITKYPAMVITYNKRTMESNRYIFTPFTNNFVLSPPPKN